jgi:hypothetical protein
MRKGFSIIAPRLAAAGGFLRGWGTAMPMTMHQAGYNADVGIRLTRQQGGIATMQRIPAWMPLTNGTGQLHGT